jgi:hypothetical protein
MLVFVTKVYVILFTIEEIYMADSVKTWGLIGREGKKRIKLWWRLHRFRTLSN